jgi:hypothetical protein
MAKAKVEQEEKQFPKKFKHKDSEVVITALNDIQAAAFINQGFEEVEE